MSKEANADGYAHKRRYAAINPSPGKGIPCGGDGLRLGVCFGQRHQSRGPRYREVHQTDQENGPTGGIDSGGREATNVNKRR